MDTNAVKPKYVFKIHLYKRFDFFNSFSVRLLESIIIIIRIIFMTHLVQLCEQKNCTL